MNGKKIGIIGAGPSALFILKRLVEANVKGYKIDIFEKGENLGSGMPYSSVGAGPEHVTNISAVELPELFETVKEFIAKEPKEGIDFDISAAEFNDFKVMPRIFFGRYLESQFRSLTKTLENQSNTIKIYQGVKVSDLIDLPLENQTQLITEHGQRHLYNQVIICTGHKWTKTKEGQIPGYFDSPYPPSKINQRFNHPVCLRGGGLTAIDAIRTLAIANGNFIKDHTGKTTYVNHKESANFRIDLKTKKGLLPAIRIHLDEPNLTRESVLSDQEIEDHRSQNLGFVSLDFIFEKDFKEQCQKKDPQLYQAIKDLNVEEFVEVIMNRRESKDPFELFKLEYQEALNSITKEKPIHWKEILAQLGFALNIPSKYFSAEDRLKLEKKLMPLIGIIISSVPQSSCQQLMALHEAGKLNLDSVGEDSELIPLEEGGIIYNYTNDSGEAISLKYNTFIDCIGQKPIKFEHFLFPSLIENKSVSQARFIFKDSNLALREIEAGNQDVCKIPTGEGYYLNASGIAINDHFQIIDDSGNANERIFNMAVPYMSGFNPDYSGLDFCHAASKRIVDMIC